MSQERILEKIKKCLALSESPVAAEAAAALRQAQKLMELHGISQLDLKRADLGTAEFRSKASVSRLKDWELRLVTRVANAFGCRLMWSKSSSYSMDVYGRFILLGLKSQVELAQYTCDVMTRRLMKARAEFVAAQPSYLDRAEKTRNADGFCHGWVAAVERTVQEFAVGAELKQLIEDELAERAKGPKVKAQERDGSAAGFLAGQKVGSKESIHRPVNGGAETLRLGRS